MTNPTSETFEKMTEHLDPRMALAVARALRAMMPKPLPADDDEAADDPEEPNE